MNGIEYLPVAIRVHTTRQPSETDTPKRPRLAQRELPRRTIVFDCETTTDETQRLLFGVWRLYIDAQDAAPGSVCIEEGIFYADDLPTTDPDGYQTLRAYAKARRANVAPGYRSRLRVLSRSEFVDQLIWKQGYKNQATIVGYNLPFDLTRLATYAAPARKTNRGGISLRLWEYRGREHPYRPRIALRAIDAHRTLIQFTGKQEGTTPDGTPVPGHFYRGKFLDLRTLAFAHTDRRGLTLETACERFETGYTKRDVTHGTITADYISYCREDVEATARLFQATHVEHLRHPIALAARNTYSAATIGKAYWKTLGITPFTDRDVWLDPQVAGWGMAAFYGGRAECRIRKVDVPVVYCDFVSMYQTCNTLMGTWSLVTADHLIVTDNTAETRQLLDRPDLAHALFDPALWPILHTLVEVEPNGATLPVRARYDRETWGIGINPYHSTRSCWYPLADVLATKLLGGPTPNIIRSYRITGSEAHPNLATSRLFGHIDYNPVTDDFFATTVEQRHLTRTRKDLTAAQREGVGRFCKVLANSTGFGILAQYDRTHTTTPTTLNVHTDRDTFTITTDQPEDAGSYTTPPIAACLTGAARLMLALLEQQVTTAGGTYTFCDTDSMAIVATRKGAQLINCPGGPHTLHGNPAIRTLSWQQVNSIIERFAALNPYKRTAVPGSILRIEDENYHPGTRRQREVRCYAISAKRYQLTSTNGESVKRSEHGLGHLQNPAPGTDWITDAWHHLTHPTHTGAEWLDLPALSKVTISSPEALHWFAHLNRNRPYPAQIKPWNFLHLAHPDPLDPTGAQPIAPYNADPQLWLTMPWIDRNTGQPITISTRPLDGTYRPGTVRVRTYRDVLIAYLQHPETKALAPDRTPVTGDTYGLLQRRPVHALPTVTYIGKEAHDLDNRSNGITTNTDTAEYQIGNPDWHTLVLATLRTIPTRDIATATGVNLRTVQRALANKCTPHTDDRHKLTEYAIQHARTFLGAKRNTDNRSTFYEYLQLHNNSAATQNTRSHDVPEK